MIEDTVKSTNSNIKNEAYALKDNFSNLTKEVGNKASEKLSDLKGKGKEVAEKAEEKAYELGERARESFDQAEDILKDGVHYIEAQTKSHPYVALGLSFAAGMLLGKMGSNATKND